MTSVSHSVAPADVRAPPKAKARNPALDRTRTFLALVVLLHHAVIPYTYFGHTDPKSWISFDCVVLATDSFFMAMFFFLSGLFVWPGLSRGHWGCESRSWNIERRRPTGKKQLWLDHRRTRSLLSYVGARSTSSAKYWGIQCGCRTGMRGSMASASRPSARPSCL